MEKPNNGSRDGARPLGEIKDSAIILSLGKEYLCVDPILIKIGRVIEQNVEKTREEISAIKRRFPGKYDPEINAENILAEIQALARALQQPNKELSQKCRTGDLGKGLEDKAKALARAVGDVRLKAERERPSYSVIDAFFNLFSRLSGVRRPLGGILSWILKIIFVLFGFSVLTGAYLFITMDREPRLLKKIASSESRIESKQAVIFDLEAKHNEMIRRVADIEKKELTRQDKIAIMDLEIEMHNIDDEKQRIQAEIGQHRDNIREYRKKIRDIKERSFWKRMLNPILSLF